MDNLNLPDDIGCESKKCLFNIMSGCFLLLSMRPVAVDVMWNDQHSFNVTN